MPRTIWKKWLDRNPDTRVLSLETGYSRDYRPGRPYASYFKSPDLMFPALVNDDRLAAKDYVFALRLENEEKAWSLGLFEHQPVLNDTIGVRDIVLIGDPETRTVRAYSSNGLVFTPDGNSPAMLRSGNDTWQITEDALVGPDDRRLDRLPGHIAYWFA